MNSDFKIQKSEVPTELFVLLYRYVFVCEIETYSEGPVNTLKCLSVGSIMSMLYRCLRRWLNIKTLDRRFMPTAIVILIL